MSDRVFRENIEAMAGYVPGEQPQQDDTIKLNTNENPYPPSPRVIEAIRQAAGARLRKYPDPVANAFRDAAAKRFGLTRDQIIAGNGGDDILTIVTRAFVGHDDLVISPSPSYVLYKVLADLQDARFQAIPFADGWQLPDDFGHRDVRLAFVPNPNSPTGTMVSNDALVRVADRIGGALLIDEAYVDFAETDAVELVNRHPRIIVLRSMSKSYALAGARFGFAMAQEPIVAGLMKVKDSYNCDALSIAAATAAIEDQAHMRANRDRVCATRARLTERLRAMAFTVLDSQANFVWTEHARVPASDIYKGLKARRILVRYMKYRGELEGNRISIGTDGEIDALLDALGPIVG